MKNKLLLAACLIGGLVLYFGLRTAGWVAHMIVPGLLLGTAVFGIVLLVRRL